MKAEPATKNVVLLGIGHTNAQVLRSWRKQPLGGTQLICVSNFPIATYSGMLPGVLAGRYACQQMQIDLVRLCTACGAELVLAQTAGLDVDGKRLLFEDRPPIRFDVLSIGIGSIPTTAGVEELDDTVVPIKPMQTFIQRLDSRLCEVIDRDVHRPLQLAIVGGGAAGVEIAFCLVQRMQQSFRHVDYQLTLVTADQQLMPGGLSATSRLVTSELHARGITLVRGAKVRRVSRGTITLDDQSQIEADVVLWATGAAAPDLLSRLQLPLAEDGFLLTDATLKTTFDAPVFAVGDSGTIAGHAVPKAGVFAVRQGPILWENIQRSLAGKPLVKYQPQHRFLKLLNTGEGRAIGEYPLTDRHGITLHNRWMWKLKDWIDRRFIAKCQELGS